MTNDKTRYTIYARQSLTRNEDESLSIEMQVKSCQQFVAARGGIVVGVFEEPDTRGWRTDRPQFNAMLDVFRQGRADVCVVFKLSRFARNLIHQETVLKEVEEAGGELVSVTEPYLNGSPMVRQILGAVNEQAKRDQSDFLRAAYAARSKHGKHHGPPPLGYISGPDGRLIIEESEAEPIRLMFQWAREGHGSPEITYRLNELGLTTRKGRKWTQSTVIRMLRRRTFAGHVTLNGDVVAHNAHPAIIHPDVFDEVQEALSRRQHIRRKESPSWADGFVYHACGTRMYVSRWRAGNDERWRFRCGLNYRARKDRDEPICHHPQKTMFHDRVEDTFLALLTDAMRGILEPEDAYRVIESRRASSQHDRDRDRQRVQRRIDDVTRQRDRLLDMTLSGRVDDEMYVMRDGTLKGELERLQGELGAIPPDISLIELQNLHTSIVRSAGILGVVAHREPGRLPEILHALDVRMIIGDGDPYLRFGVNIAPFFIGS